MRGQGGTIVEVVSEIVARHLRVKVNCMRARKMDKICVKTARNETGGPCVRKGGDLRRKLVQFVRVT